MERGRERKEDRGKDLHASGNGFAPLAEDGACQDGG